MYGLTDSSLYMYTCKGPRKGGREGGGEGGREREREREGQNRVVYTSGLKLRVKVLLL